MEFTGCNFSGADVARVEMRQAGTLVAYGAAPLVGGAASFPLYDVDTGAVWLATLGVTYTGTAYCFDGSVGDPAPTSDYWRLNMTNYTQYQQSPYSEIDFRGATSRI